MISKAAGQGADASSNENHFADEFRTETNSARLFSLLMEHLPQPVFVMDRNGKFISVNAAFASMLHLKQGDFMGKTWCDFFSKALVHELQNEDARALAGGENEGKIGVARIEGIHIIRTPVKDEQGNVIGLLGIFEESVASKVAAEKSGASAEEFRSIWENSVNGMRLTDEEGTILLVNQAFCRLVGKPETELVGKPFSTVYEHMNPESIISRHRERFRTRDVEPQFERELLLWHGGKVWFELSNSFLEIPGKPVRLLSIFRDITERKIAEEKLHRFAAQLERSNRELQDFAYVASHDLQEPLRKVAMFSDRLKIKFGNTLTEEGFDYIDRMQKATTRMQTLISDLLSFSRVTSKSQPFVPVDLNETLAGVLADLESRIEQSGAKIEAGSLPTIEAEPLHMRQLLQNLIGNALKYHKPDEKPFIRIEAAIVHDKIRRAELDGTPCAMMRLVVSDNGIGFDERYLDKIFQVFQRLHGRDVYEGTGMGLAISRKIVEHHNGEITAKSKPGQGAAFIVTLPVKQRKMEK